MEIDEHSAQFVYTGESAGTNMVIISYIPGKQPEEALYDLTSEWEDQEAINRREGFFPGTYASDNEKLVLNDDHNGVLSIQDDVDIIWGSNYTMATDGSFKYDFSIEGDNLYLNYDGKWLEFNKLI